MIRAKLVGQQEVNVGNDIYGHPIKRIKYDIKQIKVCEILCSMQLYKLKSSMNMNVFFFFCLNHQMFKGPNQDFEAIYTAPSSAVCGVTLETNGNEYLITGTPRPPLFKLHSDT